MVEITGIQFGIISYLSRSGSTFLSQNLNKYNDICVMVEGGFPGELFAIKSYTIPQFNSITELKEYLKSLIKFSKINSWGIDPFDKAFLDRIRFPISGKDLIEQLMIEYRNLYKPKARIILYKGVPIMPWYINDTLLQFKNWKIIHLFRDPRAVYSSQKTNIHPYENVPFAISPFQTAIEWKNAMDSLTKISSENLFQLKYENLIDNYNHSINSVLDFLKSDKVLQSTQTNEFASKIPDQEKKLHAFIENDPDIKLVNTWRNKLTDFDIHIIQKIDINWLTRYGYNIIPVKAGWLNVKHEFAKYVLYKNYLTTKRIFKSMLSDPRYYFKKLKSLLLN
jgi:hypothetical protein